MPTRFNPNSSEGPLHALRAFFHNRIKWRTRISRSEHAHYERLFSDYSSFYRGLSVDSKAKVLHRVLHFSNTKKFVGQGITLTDDIRVLISLAAIKLTFGLERYLIPHLHTIRVMSDVFYSKMLDTHVKGLTFENGTVCLSWKDVMSGMADETDGLHLAVHEMAHALKIDTVIGDPAHERFAFYLNTWLRAAEKRVSMSAQNALFRSYALTNMHEFFAVCMENFIERPKKMFELEPEMFAHTCYLLNQFPLEPQNRRLDTKALQLITARTAVRFPNPSEKDYSHHSWHWSLTLLLASMFISPIIIGALTYDVELPLGGLVTWLSCSVLAGMIFHRPVYRYKVMNRTMFTVFLLMGAGPALMSGSLILDRMFPVQTWNEAYEVESAHHRFDRAATVVTLKNGALNDHLELRTFEALSPFISESLETGHGITLQVTYNRGLFGVKRISDPLLSVEKQQD